MEQRELQKEKQHLHETKALIRAQIDQAAQEGDAHAATVRALARERLELGQMDVGGMYSAQGFEDLLEQSQGTQTLAQMQGTAEGATRTLRKLLRMQDHPYFARIDFRFEDGETEPIYIGRATLMEEDSLKIHVYDWRVPIASVFYQYGVGAAQYEAPSGPVRGDVLLKRQYEIEHGELRYFFDANEEVLDGFLRELLSKPAAPEMKTIVETIQRDQDRIIRDMQTDLLMVQGSAGSGKTSVALHRVAYLMYQGLQKGRLSPGDILILAPNATFERYISHVLPDLGEKQVQTLLLEDLLGNLLPGVRVESRGTWVENWLTRQDAAQKRALRRVRALKGSSVFLALLDRLIHELPRRWIPFSDITYAGQTVAKGDLMRTAACNAPDIVPLGARLRRIEKSIWQRIHALRPARYDRLLRFAGRYPHRIMEVQPFARMLSIRESGRLSARIQAFTRIDCVLIYRALLADPEAFARLASGLLPAEEIEPLRTATHARLCGELLPYEDAAAIAYLEARINGCRSVSHMRQVVVDEAQDLDLLHATLLGLLFPHARFTVLGDVHQSLTGGAGLSLYDEIGQALQKPSSLLVRLDKSFRCTREIWAFSAQFLPPGEAGDCFSRSGEIPGVHRAKDPEEMDALLLGQAQACRAQNCRSIALLCKTQRDAVDLYDRLRGEKDVVLIGPGDAIQAGRLCILSLYQAKGLEFDAVLLCNVDAAHYQGAEDQSLLYIGCTRALHVLHLFYTGERSPLLPADEEESQ